MKKVSSSQFHKQLEEILTLVVEHREEIVITRGGKDSLVILPLAEYDKLLSIVYASNYPAQVRRLRNAIQALDTGKGESHSMIDEN